MRHQALRQSWLFLPEEERAHQFSGIDHNESLRACLFLDRDGVINQDLGFVSSVEEVKFLDGIFNLCSSARRLGMMTVVITNQSGIERNFFDRAQLDFVMRFIAEEISAHGGRLDDYFFSPHMPDEEGGGKILGFRRKPDPEMFLKAAESHGIDLRNSVMVGDRLSDLTAAAAAGIRHLFFLSQDIRMFESDSSNGAIRLDSLPKIQKAIEGLAHESFATAIQEGKVR